MTNYCNFDIRFVRNNKSYEDDIISINPVVRFGTLVFNVEYKIGKSHIIPDNIQKSIHKRSMRGDELKEYINILIHLLNKDVDPFIGYQFDIPNIPSIYIKQDGLKGTLNYINEYLDFLLRDWPIKHTTLKEEYSSHKYFNEDGDTIY